MSEKQKRLLFQFCFVAIALLLIEFYLRHAGYQPGDLKPNWLNFTPVDTLRDKQIFYVNNEGLIRADSFYFANTEGIYINADGFRSAAFDKPDTTKKKLLLIGDSFTWGVGASPLTNCFADLLQNETPYQIINTGIPVADPVQYLAIAQKYIPQLRPDYVLVLFFMGNDLMKTDRTTVPGEPFCYMTNAGAIMADIDGLHFKTPEAAYNYFVNEKYYLHRPENIFEWVVSKSALLSRLYSVRFRLQEKMDYENAIKHTAITKKYLAGIKTVCEQNNVPVKFVLIPEIKEADMPLRKYYERYSDLLLDSALRSHWIAFENSGGYYRPYPDAHLNNAGHRLYADSLKAFLKNVPELK